MKLLSLLLATAGLSGCVGYVPYYASPGDPYYGNAVPYGVGSSVYIYSDGRDGRRGPGYREGRRDRDHDAARDRSGRDRDGDGVPNRFDGRPNDPRRR